MTNPYDPMTGKWLTPFSWAPAATTTAASGAPFDLSGFLSALGNGGSGQERTGSVGGSKQDNGYNGEVHNLKDFALANLGGFGAVLGGPLAGPAAIASLFASGGTTMSPTMTALQALGLMGSHPSVVGGVLDNTDAGNFGGKTGVETSSVGHDLNDAAGLASGDNRGDRNSTTSEVRNGEANPNEMTGMNADVGERTSEARNGFAGGGLVTPDRLSPTVGQYSNDDRRLMDYARDAAPQNAETNARWGAAMDAASGARYNELSPEQQAKFREFLMQNRGRDDLLGGERNIDHARASYPGFAHGGLVTPGSLAGPNPAGPDQGYAALKPGEFVLSAPATHAIGHHVLAILNAALSKHRVPFGLAH